MRLKLYVAFKKHELTILDDARTDIILDDARYDEQTQHNKSASVRACREPVNPAMATFRQAQGDRHAQSDRQAQGNTPYDIELPLQAYKCRDVVLAIPDKTSKPKTTKVRQFEHRRELLVNNISTSSM